MDNETIISTGRSVELLAPAGNMTCLHAAVRAGADAVYLGAGEFNARRGADNFTLEELREACDYAHLRGVKVYLTLNTVVLPSELPDAMELARQAYRAGVDAFIVQDPGVAAEIMRTIQGARVHVSTQMNTHDVNGLRAAAELGAKRVTLARELSLEEIAVLSAAAADMGLEVETFGHGAICVCYSGQCFMSSLIGGRSANRGRCAQACRLPYTLHNRALKSKDLPAPGEHLLSPKDLCTAEIMPELVEAGVSSLKVEGRMKSPDYVSAVVGVYRQVIDRTLAWLAQADPETPLSEAPRATEGELQILSEAFSRGFTTAYMTNERGNEIMSYGRPNNRGIFVGRVVGLKGGRVEFEPEIELHVGDVVEFWTNRGHFVHTIDELVPTKRGVSVAVPRAVGKGDRVFRVRNAEAAYVDEPREPKVAVNAYVRLRIGQPALVSFTTMDGNSATQEGDVVEAARTKALTEQDVRDHVDRMGSTNFTIASMDVELDEGVGMGFSALHKLRAAAAEQLEVEILRIYHDRRLERTQPQPSMTRAQRGKCLVAAWATNPACARAAKRAGADLIYVPMLNYSRGEAVVAGQLTATAEQAGYPKQAIPVLPVVDRMIDEERRGGHDMWKKVKADKPVMCENLGQMVRAAEMGASVEVGPHVPVTNLADLRVMADMGASRIWLSPELSLVQIEELGELSSVPLGITIMGANELMVTEHCLLMSQGPCNQECATCPRRKSPHYLKDRKGYEMPVVTDCTGRSHLYNAVSLDIARSMPDLVGAGITSVMVDTTLMNVAETTKAVQRAVRARDLAQRGDNRVGKAEGVTSGHLFRGVM